MTPLSHRNAVLLYVLLFGLLVLPFWGAGEVIAPYRQYQELALPDTSGSTRIENRKFGDFANAYIPEISEHLSAPRSGWLALWTNSVELGRPLYQDSGFSPAYLPSWLLSRFTKDPWRMITVLSLLTCFLAGLFVMMFTKEVGLHPWASLIAGAGFAASPGVLYWLTFPMFPAAWCWTAGALWSVTRLENKPDLIGWGCLAFSIYSLLMTAYPQSVVYGAYLLGGYGLVLASRAWRLRGRESVRFVAIAASAVCTGIALSLPVYLDLAQIYSDSARVAPDLSFFTQVLPKVDSPLLVLRLFISFITPELFGNPIAADYPLSYDGVSITLLMLFFSVVGLLVNPRRVWGWWLAIGVLCLLSFVGPFYAFGVKYLGLSLSRTIPLGESLLPFTIVTAYGVDVLVRRSAPHDYMWSVRIAMTILLLVVVLGLVWGRVQGLAIRWDTVAALAVLIALLAVQLRKTSPLAMLAALATVYVAISFPLLLRQDPSQIAKTSPLVEAMRVHLPPGTRYAVAVPGIRALPPNLNATVGLASIHSYNSLSSKRYHVLIESLGGEVSTYGRWNAAVAPDYQDAMFWMSNIGLVLSPLRLTHANLEYVGETSGVHLYRVRSRMGDQIQVVRRDGHAPGDTRIPDPRRLPNRPVSRTVHLGDQLEFDVTPGAPSVLVLSQKYHPDWQASVFDGTRWHTADTTAVNGVFQGVILPVESRQVRMEFTPFVRYTWMVHVVWILLLALVLASLWQRRQAGRSGVSAQ